MASVIACWSSSAAPSDHTASNSSPRSRRAAATAASSRRASAPNTAGALRLVAWAARRTVASRWRPCARQRFDQGAHRQPQLGPRARAVPLVEQAGERRHRMPRLVQPRCRRHQRVAGDAGEEPVVDLFRCGDGIGEMACRRRRIALGEAFAVQVRRPAADARRADICGQRVQRIAVAGRRGVVAGVAGRQPEVEQRQRLGVVVAVGRGDAPRQLALGARPVVVAAHHQDRPERPMGGGRRARDTQRVAEVQCLPAVPLGQRQVAALPAEVRGEPEQPDPERDRSRARPRAASRRPTRRDRRGAGGTRGGRARSSTGSARRCARWRTARRGRPGGRGGGRRSGAVPLPARASSRRRTTPRRIVRPSRA